MTIILSIASILLILVVWMGYLLWCAYVETENAPRETMVECHSGKHGPYPRRFAHEQDLGLDKPVLICPFCLSEAFERAKEAVRKENAPVPQA